jgi:hypothetical protein
MKYKLSSRSEPAFQSNDHPSVPSKSAPQSDRVTTQAFAVTEIIMSIGCQVPRYSNSPPKAP